MRTLNMQRLTWSLMLATMTPCIAAAAQEGMPEAPSIGLTRQQVTSELMAAQATHRWDEPSAQWSLREPMEAPASGRTRREVRSELATHMRSNRWDESLGGWIPVNAQPVADGGLTRAQVAANTIQFLETHDWNDYTQVWTERANATRRQ